jgi:uncharacterized membrane protein YfcA
MQRLLVTLLTATLSGLGVGGAGILVLYLTRTEGVSQLTAQGLNLLLFLASGGISFLLSLKKTPPLWRYQRLLLLTGIPGALLGAELAAHLPAGVLRHALGALLILCGLSGLFGKKKK